MKLSQNDSSRTEQLQWEALLESTFDRPLPKTPIITEKQKKLQSKTLLHGKRWPWVVLAVLILSITAVCIVQQFLHQDQAADLPAELLVCKEALAEWQALDSYKITHYAQRITNNSIPNSWYQYYWVNGEDWILEHRLYSVSSSTVISPTNSPIGYMYRDGEFFQSFSYLHWQPYTNTTATPELTLWPMVFSWEDCQLIYQSTVETEAGTLVNFSVIGEDPTQLSDIASDYHVQFHLSINGGLQSICVVQIRSDLMVTKDTYTLSSSDPDQIAQYIAKQQIVELSDEAVEYPEGIPA